MVTLESNRIKLYVGAVCVFAAGSTIAQTKWDMPTGYAPTNFHTENVKQFAAECVITVSTVFCIVSPNAYP